jgi:hypothetical protein
MRNGRADLLTLIPGLLLVAACGATGGWESPAHGPVVPGAASPVLEGAALLTRAERSGFEETTRYAEVVEMLEALAERSPALHLTRFGYSLEGRALPLMVWGAPGASPEQVAAAGKTRVFVQANIHAGEVEGKEAMLILLRELAEGRHAEWADSLVLLVAPIYNADGNERVSLSNRPRQHGPLGGMGQRPNAQGYDLNRDHMKLDTPEAHALASLLTRYDPHLAVDLHATNGTYHGYHLTYSPPLHPNTDPAIVRELREVWLPSITERARTRHGREMYFYGNVNRAESQWAAPAGAERGWYTFDHRPRFNNNYVGMRNRFAILSEAYAYLPFEDRIRVTGEFVREILEQAAANAGRIRALTEAADRASIVGEELAVGARFHRSDAPVPILMGEVVQERNPYSGETILRRGDSVRTEMMPEFGTFSPTETEVVPAAYLVPAGLTAVVAKLAAHGIRMESLATSRRAAVERFRIESSVRADNEFQGHRERTLTGRYEATTLQLAEGTVVVPMDQPLARLAFYLLEPRSDDGLLNWNVLDREIEGAEHYPVWRALEW